MAGQPDKRDSPIIIIKDRIVTGAIECLVLPIESISDNRIQVCLPGIVELAGLISAKSPERANTTSSHTVSIRALMPLDPIDDLYNGQEGRQIVIISKRVTEPSWDDTF